MKKIQLKQKNVFEAIEKKCKLNDSFYWKGTCYYKLKQYDKAFECFNNSNEINPDN
jgi:tetratricopeptide (TPR) repeat protein